VADTDFIKGKVQLDVNVLIGIANPDVYKAWVGTKRRKPMKRVQQQ
jgi:hypothetical protein